MPPKSKLAGTVLTPERHAQLKATAAAQGLTVSSFLGRLIDIVLEEGEAPAPGAVPSKSRREGKVTARLPRGVREKLEEEAKSRGVTASTWVGSMLQARYCRAPQPLPPDRALIQRAFRNLRGVAININQMVTSMDVV